MADSFTGFGLVMQIGLTLSLVALWNSQQRARQASSPATTDTQLSQRQTFEQLQTLLVNYPTVTKVAQAKPEMRAQQIISLFKPLENLLDRWGYEAIGQPWMTVAFDPQLHQPDVPDIQPDETVYIRFVGYRCGNEILVPAKVSRTLPGET